MTTPEFHNPTAEMLKVGAQVVVDHEGEGIVTRIAVSPKHPNDPDFWAVEVKILTDWRPRRIWRNSSYIKVIL